METLDSIGINLFVLAALKELHLWVSFAILFVCLRCLVPVSVHLHIVFSQHFVWQKNKNGRFVRFSKRTDCWWAFSWSICNQNGHLTGCIQSSSFQGYDGIHIMGRRHKLSGTVAENQNQVKGIAVNWRGLYLKIIELLQLRWQETSVFILKTVSTKTVWRELHKSNIRGRAAVAQPPITEG
jgi:hypothetical protein